MNLPTERRSATLIFNPIAGSGDPEADLAGIRKLLDPEFDLNVVETTKDTSGKDLAKRAVDAGAKLIISAGGDGTVAEVATALIGTDSTLGIIPRGTANALAVALFGDGLRLNPIRTSCEAIVAGASRLIDTVECNGKPMLLLGGIGIETGMVQRAERELKSKFGVLAYLIGGWEQITEQEDFDVELTCDDRTQTLRTASVVVANAAPPTSIFAQGHGQPVFDDGMLDVTTIVDVKTTWEAVQTMVGLLNAGLTQSPAGASVLHFHAKTVKITANPQQKLVIDGEIEGTTPVEFVIRPQTLRVIAPAPNAND